MSGDSHLLSAAEAPWRQPATSGGPVAGVSAVTCAGAIVVGLFAAASTGHPALAVLAKALADPFLSAASAGAAVLLLLAASAALAVWRWAPSWGDCGDAGLRRAVAVFGGAVALGLAANLAAHLATLQALDMPPLAAAHHWQGEAGTVSTLLHSHAGKAAFGGWLGAAAASAGYDVGQGLAGHGPGWAGPLCLLAIVFAAATGLHLVVLLRRRHAGGWTVMLFVLCAVGLVASVADGGPLGARPALLGAMLVLLFAHELGLTGAPWARACALAAVLPVATLAAWSAWGDPMSAALWASLASSAVVLAWLALQGPWRPAGGPAERVRRAAGIGVAVVVLASVVRTIAPLAWPLPRDAVVHVCDPMMLQCRAERAAGRAPYALYRTHGDDPLKPRRVMIVPPDASGPRTVTMAFRPLARGAPRPHATGAVRVVPLMVPPRGIVAPPGERLPGGPLVQFTAAQLPPVFGPGGGVFEEANRHVMLHLAAATLRAQGHRAFVLSPLPLPPGDPPGAAAGRISALR